MKKPKLKIHKIRRKKYINLKSFKSELELYGVEKVKSFDGHKIITNKNSYTLFDNTLYVNGEPHGIN